MSKSIGQTVVCYRVGEGNGSVLQIQLENGDYYTIICCWRLECEGVVILSTCSTIDSCSDLIENTLGRLVGEKILSYELSDHYDLKLCFENSFIVRVFCNVIRRCSEEESLDYLNWYYSIPQQNLEANISGHFELVYSKYDDNSIIIS